MADHSVAEKLNDDGMRLLDEGDVAGAEAAYRAAMAADPTWSAPAYNLGLLCKYEGRWLESLEFNQQAAERRRTTRRPGGTWESPLPPWEIGVRHATRGRNVG